MKRIAAIVKLGASLGLLVAVAIFLNSPARAADEKKAGEEKKEVTTLIGKPAPTFSGLSGTDGKTYGLDSFKDKKAVVVFVTCNPCPYVVAWEDRIVAVANDYAGKGVSFIAVNANDTSKSSSDNLEGMKKRAADKNFSFPYVRDDNQEVAKAYQAEFTPEFYVLDEQRVIRYHGKIDDNHKDASKVEHKYLRDALDAVLAGKAPETTETRAQGCTIKWKDGNKPEYCTY